MQANDINIAVHVGTGVLGLAVGLIPMFSAKGGRIHRRAGKIFLVLAGIAIATAALADLLLLQPLALIAATLSAGYQYLAGLRALHLRHRGPGVLDAVLACGALIGCAWLVMALGPGRASASWSPAIGYAIVGYLGAVALYDLSRPFWARYWLRRIRPLDHGLKMTGCYFAMLSAGAGNSLRAWQPWSQIVPSSLGSLVLIVLAIVYLRRPVAREDLAGTEVRTEERVGSGTGLPPPSLPL